MSSTHIAGRADFDSATWVEVTEALVLAHEEIAVYRAALAEMGRLVPVASDEHLRVLDALEAGDDVRARGIALRAARRAATPLALRSPR